MQHQLTFICILLFSFFLSFCSKEKYNHTKSNLEIPPDDLHLLDKLGLPSEEFLQHRAYEINKLKTNQLNSRNNPSIYKGLWTTEGPGNLGGRVNTIAINPINENIIFIGFSHGGAYRTLDGGMTWAPVFDNEISLYISDIAIDPNDTRIIYLTTGDHNGGFYCGQGNGIYKSQDNGDTWSYIGLSETRVLSEILIDYKNSNILYAASLGYSYEKNNHRGLYKSNDGGASWTKILFINDSAGITDIAIHPVDPNIIFAVSWNKLGTNNRSIINGPDGQIYKSVDAGNHWTKLTNGLPSDSINGRIAIDIAKSQPNIMYARYVRTYSCNGQSSNHLFGLYKSVNTGDSWEKLPALEAGSGLECDCLGGFGWYFHSIAVNPKDPDDIFIMGVDMFRSKNGGLNWELAVPDWSVYEVHADKHELRFMSNGDFLLATDGGLYKYLEALDEWKDIENIPTNQVYRVAYNPNKPDQYYGGLQDNGSTGGNKLTINSWERIYGGDGFQMAFKKDDPLIYYAEYQNGNLQQYVNGNWRRFTNGLGGSKNWDFPYMISRHNSSKLLAGSTQVYYNASDTSANWKSISPTLTGNARYPSRSTPTITSIDESPLDSNVLIAGTINGNVWATKEFNQNWINISSNLPSAYISSVKTSYFNSSHFFTTLSGHRGNDFKSYVYKTLDGGGSWQSIQGDLPALPVYDILVYPKNNDSVLFIGTHIGVFASVNGGESWKRVGDNMPFIEVFDLEINESEQSLIAATFGKSIMSFPLENILKQVVSNKNEIASKTFEVYPNPSSHQLSILGAPNCHNVKSYMIYNSFGVYIKKICNPSLENSIDICDLPAGLYFLNFRCGEKFYTSSFIKQ